MNKLSIGVIVVVIALVIVVVWAYNYQAHKNYCDSWGNDLKNAYDQVNSGQITDKDVISKYMSDTMQYDKECRY